MNPTDVSRIPRRLIGPLVQKFKAPLIYSPIHTQYRQHFKCNHTHTAIIKPRRCTNYTSDHVLHASDVDLLQFAPTDKRGLPLACS